MPFVSPEIFAKQTIAAIQGYSILAGGPLAANRILSIPDTTFQDIQELLEEQDDFDQEEEVEQSENLRTASSAKSLLYHTHDTGPGAVAKRRREREMSLQSGRSISRRGNTGNGSFPGAEMNAEADSLPIKETDGNASDGDVSSISASTEIDTSGISHEIRETIRRSHHMKPPLPHNKVAALVGLSGRHYGIYQQLCREMNLK